MTLQGKSTLYGHGTAETLYLAIPASIAKDSQFALKPGDIVHLEYDPNLAKLTVSKQSKTPIQFAVTKQKEGNG